MSMPCVLLKVILLGDSTVGKSSLMQRFVNDKFEQDNYRTIGVEFLRKEIIVNDHKYLLQIWDTAGQERYRTLRTPFYRGADICVLTFSFDQPESFYNLDMWRREFIKYSGITTDGIDCDFPFIVFGNKCDLDQSAIPHDMVQAWCKNYGKKLAQKIQIQSSNTFSKPETITVEYQKTNGELQEKLDQSYLNFGQTIEFDAFQPDGIPFLVTSAKENTNVELGFHQVVALWEKLNGYALDAENPNDNIIKLQKNSLFQRVCCFN